MARRFLCSQQLFWMTGLRLQGQGTRPRACSCFKELRDPRTPGSAPGVPLLLLITRRWAGPGMEDIPVAHFTLRHSGLDR